ncbi:Hsp70 family protein [Falsihalocynthiibacter arcticus]|uniref:Molecular chaperone DnaK n=1 Tax=Falsihalocynthiibacter arcticus TaxID=1579316 RepID=A0A126UZ95_9RHOB|nr:Hsp70 family protein [Falsihalocynthiibacter arcticus]AML51383.1 molecular chaperone DnaK [Falsihalocynthiibacter arcticus]
MNALGIDFGTSNSAAGVLVNDKPFLIEVEAGEKTLPTAVFFPQNSAEMRIGSAANRALIQGEEGRYMRALKSVLGTSLMHEKRRIMGAEMTISDIIARFLEVLKTRAEAQCYTTFERALSGRPVRFHSKDEGRNTQALADLTECYLKAGFKEVSFMPEPEAAALASHARQDGSLGLVVDIGGGTSDFTVFRKQAGTQEILASHGVRLGGTHFDKRLSVRHVMPLLGKDSLIGKEFGEGALAAPSAIFQDLATWEKIPFLYTQQTRLAMAKLGKLALEPVLFSRLLTVLTEELGHEVAFAVERAKILVNQEDRSDARIDMKMIEAGLFAVMSDQSMADSLAEYGADIRDAVKETLVLAGVSEAQIEQVVFVGGSSLMSIVDDGMRAVFPAAEFLYSEAFTGVVDGLAIAASRQS